MSTCEPRTSCVVFHHIQVVGTITPHRLVGEKPNDPMVCIPMIGLYPKFSITKNVCLFFRNPTKNPQRKILDFPTSVP